LIAGGSCQNAPYGCYVTGHNITTGKELCATRSFRIPTEKVTPLGAAYLFANRWCTRYLGQIRVRSGTEFGALRLQRHLSGVGFPARRRRHECDLGWDRYALGVRPDTGEIVWRRQLLPQDNWDQECTFEMMVVDTPMHPNPNAEGMLAANPNIAEAESAHAGGHTL